MAHGVAQSVSESGTTMIAAAIGPWFRATMAGAAILALSGCFYSDTALIAAGERVQPVDPGLWERLVPFADDDWAKLTAEERQAGHCRRFEAANYCSERVAVAAGPDGSYRVTFAGDDEASAVAFAKLSGNRFIVEQNDEGERFYYALAIRKSAGRFDIVLPDCDRDRALHAYAPPTKASAAECLVADRQRLTGLFGAFASQARAAKPQIYLKVAEE